MMEEKNYIVSIEYPLGGCCTLGIFGNLHDALIFIEGLMNNTDNNTDRFSIRQTCVGDSESIHNYDIMNELERG